MKRTTRSMLMGFSLGVIGCAILAGGGFYYFSTYYLPSQQQSIEAKMANDVSKHMQQGVVLTKPVERGENLSSQNTRAIDIPKEFGGDFLFVEALDEEKFVASRKLTPGMILYKDMLYNPEKLSADLRIFEIEEAVLPFTLKVKDFVDVRISFPSGLDYVVLSKKEVFGLVRHADYSNATNPLVTDPNANSSKVNTSNSELGTSVSTSQLTMPKMIVLHLNAHEILQYSSAIVDAFFNNGTYLYVSPYVSPGHQEAAIPNYPCNEAVQKLLLEDPNIVNFAKNALQLKQRESLNASLMTLDDQRARPVPMAQDNAGVITIEQKSPSLSDLDD